MRIGLMFPVFSGNFSLSMDEIREAEALGYDSVWVPEAYGSDAVSIVSWILAQTEKIRVGSGILQMPSRSPALCAMTAMTLDQLSGGRFICGLGASGPQVIEGWHGLPYGKPLKRTREYVAVMRKIMCREEPVTHEGEYYNLPYTGEGSTGLGKALRSTLPAAPDIPLYSASFTPGGVRTAAEIMDGVLPFFYAPEHGHLIDEPVTEGLAKRATPPKSAFDVAPGVAVSVGEDLDQARLPVKQFLGLYIGGMGAKGKNFYNDYAARMGYEKEALEVQDLFLSGKQKEAILAVPDSLVDEVALVGPLDRIRERAQVWKQAAKEGKIGTMLLKIEQPEYLAPIAEILLD